MPTTLDLLKDAFTRAIRGQFPDLVVDIYDAEVPVVPTTNPAFGDYQCNAAMALAKRAKLKPRDVATALVSAIGDLDGLAEKAEIAGPGFINITLAPTWIEARLAALTADSRLGVPPAASPQTVVVDYSGPNVAKQMHVGHLRSTIIGDAIARVMAFLGHNVIRQNHIGDWGTQFGMLIAFIESSAKTREYDHDAMHLVTVTAIDGIRLDKPMIGLDIADLDGFYKDARKKFEADTAFAEEARATVVRLQSGGKRESELWQQIVAESRRHFEPIYATLRVHLSAADERGESFYNPMLPGNVADLKAAGVAEQSDGATVAFTPGVEAPLILEKTGGGYGYATTDLAAIRYRVGTLGAKRILYFVGVPQSQHFKQVFDVARRSGWAGDAVLEHAAFGSVLGTDGKMFKARSGDSVKLADLLAEAEQRALAVVSSKSPELPDAEKQTIAHAVGIGAVKYADLSKDRLGDYVFDFDTMLAMDGNTAPYLQYAQARIRSIFRKAESFTPGAPITLAAPQELTLAKHLLRLGEVIEDVARDLKPHVLCQYLYDLATKFSGFYEHCPVLKSDEPTRSSRLALCDLTARTLALGLDLLGIEHPEQM
ncbi:MAG: argS [Phycisphaerales bacterium]|nr:argS [Phycisphaerales bacterium]